jgi:Asp-tRNA(Asn)/Glu-tRNA(Gln) amidotransferase C subunit
MKHVKLFEAFASTVNEAKSYKKEFKEIEDYFSKVTSSDDEITVWDFEDNKDYAVVFAWRPEDEAAYGEDQKIARSDNGDDIKTAEDFIDFVNDHAPEESWD